MTPERYQQIDRLTDAALELAVEERAAFLDQACADDQELRRQVERLLEAHEIEDGFLSAPALETFAQEMAVVQARSLIGRKLGRYRILSLLGAGGMGEVYLAEDDALGRKVALKLLPAEFTRDQDRLRRFKQEARAASSLNHPNIVTIYEIGETDEIHFIATEFIDGQTLRQRLAQGRLELSAALDVGIQVAIALSAAHEAGIVHRDIKPENLMLRRDGYLKVLDFGLSKLTEPQTVGASTTESEMTGISTAPGMVMGTINYMSPEQARGLKVDHRTDIFSLGVTLYEMLAGRRPFEGATTSDALAAILTKEPEPLEEYRNEAGPKLSRAVMRCLAKEREERYQNSSELVAILKTENERGEQPPLGGARQSPGGGIGGDATRAFHRSRSVWVATATMLMIAAFAYWKLEPKASPEAAPDAVMDTPIKSLVVLPLENLSGDPGQEYFADGMTDALIGDLAKIRGLQVISRTSAMRYKGANKPLREIASELRVDAVIEGTVMRSGNRVQVRAQLIRATTDRHVWSETYERDLRDVLAMQSEIAQAVVREIQIKIMPAERTRLAPNRLVNRKAFDDYLQGRFLYWNRRTVENLHKAISFFQSAVKEDPTYAPAYVGLADCYNALGTEMIGALLPLDARRRAEEAVNKALGIDNEMAEAHAALGFVKHYNWDWAAAERELKLAIELNPNYAYAHDCYAGFLVSKGRVEEAIAEANRAQELDPFSLAISSKRGFILENARRYDEAIEQFRRVIAMDQDNFQAHWFLSHTYVASGRFAEALAASEKAVALSRTPGALGFLGMCYGLAGRKAEANKVLKELLELNRRRYVTPPALANVYIGLGDKDHAFIWLEKAYQERSNYMAYLKVFPGDDPLRSDPRLDDLLRRMGLAP
jgi:serine/threonine-protein kinase